MEDNVLNQETELVENSEALTTETDEILESSDSGFSGLGDFVIGALCVGIAAVAFAKRDKIKEKITERQIKKLEKKGYNVSKLEVVDSEDVDSEEDTDE